jgi:hypothetical protein
MRGNRSTVSAAKVRKWSCQEPNNRSCSILLPSQGEGGEYLFVPDLNALKGTIKNKF